MWHDIDYAVLIRLLMYRSYCPGTTQPRKPEKFALLLTLPKFPLSAFLTHVLAAYCLPSQVRSTP